MLRRVFRLVGGQGRTIRSTSKRLLIHTKSYPIILSEGTRNSLKLNDNVAHITLNPCTSENLKAYLGSWYRRRARKEFLDSFNKWLEDFERLEYKIPKTRLKTYANMSRVWGRCYYQKGVITLNLRLLTMPKECIDYILLHEMAHFIAHDHGPLFLSILTRIDPHWREKEALLRSLEQRKDLMDYRL